jgi:hypothetical protein
MNMRTILALIGVMLFGAGIVMAISGASPTLVSQTRWAGNAAGSEVTQGGNISIVNVSGTVLTNKWAEYSGNVSGSINLTNGVNNVYSWTWTPATGGVLCTSTGSSVTFGSATTLAAGTIDTDWGFTAGDADSATNTYTSTCTGGLNLGESAVSANTSAATLQGFSNFKSCAVNDGTAGKAHDAFCSELSNSGVNYNNATVNYEVMVPTNNSGGATETYYFYLQLN